MKNVLGDNVTLTLFGESHGEVIGATLDGFLSGEKIDYEFIDKMLSRRRPFLNGETSRVEKDNYKLVSGVFNGYTTGAPLTVLIENSNVNSKSYEELKNTPRPSHADYTAHIKYNGFEDYRGGGHFSGRITAPIVALGAICMKALNDRGIKIQSHIYKIGNLEDSLYSLDNIDNEIDSLKDKMIPTLTLSEGKIASFLDAIKNNNDSVGGIIETAITGLDAGLGEPWFSSVEGKIANSVFSIGGVKGIEFGKGFDFVDGFGSNLNDELEYKDDQVVNKTNNNGGINGGITNSMPVIFKTAVKPTPSIMKEQNTINLETKENTTITINGRHDPSIVRRIAVVIDSITAITICDIIATSKGRNF